MNKPFLFTILMSTSLFFACSGGNQEANNPESKADVENESNVIDTLALLQGNWKIDSLSSERYELYDCEKDMNFEFTSDAGETSNGIETRVLKVTQGSENPCDFAGPNDNYETNYALYAGMLYIKNFKLDKKQFSGTMKISNLSESTLTLTSMKHDFHLSKK
jgi:hypothetical protein